MKFFGMLVAISLLLSMSAFAQEDTTIVRQKADTVIARTPGSTVVVQEQQNETLTGTRAAIKNTFGLGPRIGYYKSYNADQGNTYFGLQARLRLSPYFGIEGAVDYRTRERFTYVRNDSIQASADVRYAPVSVSAVVFLPVSFNFVPYVLGGAAWYYTIVDYSNQPNVTTAQTSNQFGYHLGAGLEIPFTEHFSIGGDYRWTFLNTKFDIGNPSTLDPKNSDGYVVTGNIMFYF